MSKQSINQVIYSELISFLILQRYLKQFFHFKGITKHTLLFELPGLREA